MKDRKAIVSYSKSRARAGWRFANYFGGLFLALVVVPTLGAIVYLGFWASDVYVSESRYIIRTSQSPVNPEISLSLSSFLTAPAILQNGYVVADYAKSMDALQHVNQSINLKELFASREVDFFSRFASVYWNDSDVRLLKYFQNHLEVVVDPITAISTLTVRAYTAESAVKINQRILEGSEALINQLNERTSSDLIRFAEFGVASARKNLERADVALHDFRSKKSTDAEGFIPKFQALTLERDTAERQLASALSALEQANVEAQRKMIYLERIVEPVKPDYPLEPYRIYGILATFAVSLMLFGIVKVIVASVREHRD